MIESARKADRQSIVFTLLIIGLTSILALVDTVARAGVA